MPIFKVKIYNVTEHELSGLDEATEFATNAVGARAEILSDEGLVLLTIIPQGKPQPVDNELVVEEAVVEELAVDNKIASNVSVIDNESFKTLTKEVKSTVQKKKTKSL